MERLFGLDDEIPLRGRRSTIRQELAAHGGCNLRLFDHSTGRPLNVHSIAIYQDRSTSCEVHISAADFAFLNTRGVLVGLSAHPPMKF